MDLDELSRRILLGRYNEVRMLYFLGKDIFRWMEQCQETIEKVELLNTLGIRTQSFAAMLVDTPPRSVTEKLSAWGVSDQRTIFSRADRDSQCLRRSTAERSAVAAVSEELSPLC